MTEMAPESAPVPDPAVVPAPLADAAPVGDPAPAPAEAPAAESAPVESSAEEPTGAAPGTVRVQLADDADGQSIVLGNYFVGLSPVEIPADMLGQFETAAEALGRKVVVLS